MASFRLDSSTAHCAQGRRVWDCSSGGGKEGHCHRRLRGPTARVGEGAELDETWLESGFGEKVVNPLDKCVV